MVVRDGVANCAGCERARSQQEQHGSISQADADRIAHLLMRDLVETIGAGHEAAVREAVARLRLFSGDPADFEQRVVDDVQQWLHDTFVDTSWPACPDHPQHPLWYVDHSWSCQQSGRRWPLGTLSRTPRDAR